jgi:hypothetical protein
MIRKLKDTHPECHDMNDPPPQMRWANITQREGTLPITSRDTIPFGGANLRGAEGDAFVTLGGVILLLTAMEKRSGKCVSTVSCSSPKDLKGATGADVNSASASSWVAMAVLLMISI